MVETSYVEYGPFPEHMIPPITEILKSHNIPFQLKQVRPTKVKNPFDGKGYRGIWDVAKILIPESFCSNLPPSLEKFGITNWHQEP